jgi:hypothetical protein
MEGGDVMPIGRGIFLIRMGECTTPQAVGGEERQRRDESRSHDLEAHEDANSVPRTPEWTCHAVLPCLLIEAAAFKSLVFSAGCHVRAGDQTGSRPALALIAR